MKMLRGFDVIQVSLFLCSALLLSGFASLSSGSAVSVAPSTQWEKTFLGDTGTCVIQTLDGGYALVGRDDYETSRFVKLDFSGNMQLNCTYDYSNACTIIQLTNERYAISGSDTFWIIDSNGKILESQKYSPSYIYSMTKINDGFIIVGSKRANQPEDNSDFWLAKINNHGILQWSKTYGGIGQDQAFSAANTNDGGYIVVGRTESFGLHVDSNSSNLSPYYDAWLVKTDSEGNRQWTTTFGGDGNDEAKSVIQASDGSYVVAGISNVPPLDGYISFLLKVDLNGRIMWNQTYGKMEKIGPGDIVNSVIETSDGGFAFAGTTIERPVQSSFSHFWLAKTDANGMLEWNKTYAYGAGGGNAITNWEANSLIETSDGSLAAFGSGRDVTTRSLEGNYFYFVKTEPTLPVPTSKPTASNFPSSTIPPNENQELTFPPTFIKPDGSVDPPTAPIQREGNVYRLKDNMQSSLIIERDDVIFDGAGFAILGNGTISNLYVRTSGKGISINDRLNATVRNTKLEHFYVALDIVNSHGITVENCPIGNNDRGISIENSSTIVRISNCSFASNNLWLSEAQGCLISGNRFTNNGKSQFTSSLSVYGGADNAIVGNTFEAGEGGIWLSGTHNNTIAANVFLTQDTESLSAIYETAGNLIYGDNFINASAIIYEFTDQYVNFFDNGTMGNYWSDYTGNGNTSYSVKNSRQNSQGIYYVPSINNTDYHPLTAPISENELSAIQQIYEQKWEQQAAAMQNFREATPSPSLLAVAAASLATCATIAAIIFAILWKKKAGNCI